MQSIREERILSGYSVLEMARQCGIDVRRLSDYELGKRRWPDEVL